VYTSAGVYAYESDSNTSDNYVQFQQPIPPVDLAITATAIPNGPVQAGAEMTLQLTVTNVSNTTATDVQVAHSINTYKVQSLGLSQGTWTPQYYGLLYSLGTLPPGGAATMTLQIVTYDQLYTSAQVSSIEPDTFNGNNSTDYTIEIGPGDPGVHDRADLTVEFGAATKVCSQRACKVRAPLAVSNIGDRTSSATVVRYYYSQDLTWDVSDTLLKQTRIRELPVNGLKLLKAKVRVPAGASGFVLAVVDPDNLVNENQENNNVAPMPGI
jgi:hypothetical protein